MKKLLIPFFVFCAIAIQAQSLWFKNDYSTEYQAVLNYGTAQGFTLPSDAIKVAQDNFVRSLKVAGVFTKFNFLHVPIANSSGTQSFGNINWINPGTFNLTPSNSPGYGTRGYTGNGTTAKLLTSWVPSTNGGALFTQDDGSIITYRDESTVSAGVIFGTSNASLTKRSIFDGHFTGGNAIFSANGSSIINTAVNDGAGLWQIKRTASNASAIFRGGLSVNTSSAASSGLSSVELYGLAENANGTPGSFSAKTIGLLAAGSSFSSTESLDFAKAFADYMKALAGTITFPDWTIRPPVYSDLNAPWNTLKPWVKQTEVTEVFGTASLTAKFGAQSGLFEGGIRSSKNGKAYYPPHNANAIAEIDEAGNIRYIGTFNAANCGSDLTKYIGGFEDPVTQILFFFPYSATKVLYYDPTTDSWGFLTGTLPTGKKYASGCGTNGRIGVGATFSAGNVIEIDPATMTWTTYSVPALVGLTQQYVTATLTDGGLVVMSPFDAPQVGEYDPVTHTFTLRGSILSGSGNYGGSFFISSTLVIFTSYQASTMLYYNPITHVTTTVAHGLGVTIFESGRRMVDGNILLCPLSQNRFAIWDVTLNQARFVGSALGGAALRLVGIVLMGNGRYLAAPFDYGSFVWYSSAYTVPLSTNFTNNVFDNKY